MTIVKVTCNTTDSDTSGDWTPVNIPDGMVGATVTGVADIIRLVRTHFPALAFSGKQKDWQRKTAKDGGTMWGMSYTLSASGKPYHTACIIVKLANS